jgi:hypothetical protein
VSAADGQLEQHRVQADEGRRPAGRATEACGGARDQCDRAEARGDGKHLERPQPAGDPEWSGRVAREREQRAVGGVLEGPAHEREDRVGWRFCRDVGVRVQAVQGSHAGEAQVAEHVLGDQRWAQEQDQVRRDYRRDERS